jgi:hypothetical protein
MALTEKLADGIILREVVDLENREFNWQPDKQSVSRWHFAVSSRDKTLLCP